MPMTVAEQYLLELINRARLDPVAEAARYGIGLNDGLAAGQIDATSKQVLAPNTALEAAAVGHSLWMLNYDVFSHTGAGGSQPWGRAEQQGYVGYVGENIALNSLSGTATLASMINVQHEAFMHSALHRADLLTERFREVGLGQEQGAFTQGGTFNVSIITELFGDRGALVYLTGVAYTDRDKDGFYSMGEGTRGVSFAIGQTGASTSDTGGYGLGLRAIAAAQVTGHVGQRTFDLTVDMTHGNVKLDVVNGNLLLTSGSVVLGTGLGQVRLLGVDGIDATGSAISNTLTGNRGGNDLHGAGGNDSLHGAAGLDRIWGDDGADQMWGDDGNDWMSGGQGRDMLWGGLGNDRLNGGIDADVMYGQTGADAFVFQANFGSDVVQDFSLRDRDTLALDNALWGNARLTEAQVVTRFADVVAGRVIFDFGNGEVIRLAGITTLAGLAGAIDFI
jgi:serralysin